MKIILLFIISVLWLGSNLNAQNTNESFSDVGFGGAIIDEEFESSLSYNDSIFATIDLGNLYLKMNDDGLKGIQGKLTQFIPKSREEHSRKTDLALRSLKTDNHPATVPLDELPEGFPEDL